MEHDPMAQVPARITWAVELLDVGPDDRVLELGCGPGVAVALVAERLDGGCITAIDRSAVAIERASARNAAHVAAGRAELRRTDLAGFDGAPNAYDKAFAVNVNAFWTGAADAESATLARVLRPGGTLWLVYEGPTPGSAPDVGPTVAANLQRHGFVTKVTPEPDAGSVAIRGQLTSGS